MNNERELARITSADIDIQRGAPMLSVGFEYEGGTCQFLTGYVLDGAFVLHFLRAVVVERLSDAVGRSCWVTNAWDRILVVAPLHKKDGEPFVIADWQDWAKRRLPPITIHEMETFEEPPKRGGA